MANESYFQFDDDKMKCKYSQNHRKEMGKLKTRGPIIERMDKILDTHSYIHDKHILLYILMVHYNALYDTSINLLTFTKAQLSFGQIGSHI